MKKTRRIEITAFRRRRLAVTGNSADANFSASSQSSDATSTDGRSLLTEDTGISADVVQLFKQISTSLEDQLEGTGEDPD